jgi:hypothetical protein
MRIGVKRSASHTLPELTKWPADIAGGHRFPVLCQPTTLKRLTTAAILDILICEDRELVSVLGTCPEIGSLNNNPTRQRGIYGNIGKTLQLNPSLTFWVVISRLSRDRMYFGPVPTTVASDFVFVQS